MSRAPIGPRVVLAHDALKVYFGLAPAAWICWLIASILYFWPQVTL